MLAIGFVGVLNKAGFSKDGSSGAKLNGNIISLSVKSNEGGGLSIEVTPVDFSFGKEVNFKIGFNTHQGDLDFDLTKLSVLRDDKNNEYLPISWEGGSSGHHIEGNILFPALKDGSKELKLVIKDIYGVKEREFFWQLN